MVEANQILTDFMINNYLAKNLTDKQLNTSLQLLDAKNKSLAESQGLTKLNQLIRYDSVQTTVAADLDRLFEKQATELGREMDRFLDQIGGQDNKNRYSQGVEEKVSPTFKALVESKMKPGFCTITMGGVFADKKELDLRKAPDYASLRPLVFCDEATIQTILTSPLYQNQVKATAADYVPPSRGKMYKPETFSNHFILVAVNNVRTAVSLSIREPNMMAELAGTTLSQ